MFFLGVFPEQLMKSPNRRQKNIQPTIWWWKNRFPRTFFPVTKINLFFLFFFSHCLDSEILYFFFRLRNKQKFLFTQENWWSFDAFVYKVCFFSFSHFDKNEFNHWTLIFLCIIHSLTHSLIHIFFFFFFAVPNCALSTKYKSDS